MYGAFLLFGFAGWYSARSIEKKYGSRAWGWPNWVWGVVTGLSLLLGAILQYVAIRQLKKESALQPTPVLGYGPVAPLTGYGPGAAALTALPEAAAPVVAAQMPAGWHPDPAGRHQHRWWDGAAWTTHVSTNGVAVVE